MSNQVLMVNLPAAAAFRHPDGVRPMNAADLPQLVALWLHSYPASITDSTSPAEVEADWRSAMNGEYGVVMPDASMVIEHNGSVIAAVQTVRDAIWDGSPNGPYITELVVRPELRRHGIGRGLLGAALEKLTIGGWTTASLRVEKDNAAARALYESFGFHPVQRSEGTWQGTLLQPEYLAPDNIPEWMPEGGHLIGPVPDELKD